MLYMLLMFYVVNLNICFLLQNHLSSLKMMLQEQRVGGYEFHTATVGEADGRALSWIFGLVWAILTFFLLLFIVWGLGLGLS